MNKNNESELKEKRTSSYIQSVDRALTLLNILARNKEEMSLTELSKEIGLPKSTVYGLLATLRDKSFISQSNESGNYYLGLRLFELGNQVGRKINVRDYARPVIEKLSKEFGETVHLGAEDNGEILYLEKVSADSLINIMSDVGVRLPIHCSALGKVLLAHKSEAERKRVISMKGLPALTSRTITTKAKLDEELEKILKQGYAIDDGEIMEGLRCVAAPIKENDGKVRYAISLSGQVKDLYGKRLDRIIEEVKEAALEIQNKMNSRR